MLALLRSLASRCETANNPSTLGAGGFDPPAPRTNSFPASQTAAETHQR
jgi:hypothetical protein